MRKKLTMMLAALMCVSAVGVAQNKKMVRPASLKPGDKIAILSMASKPNDVYAKAGLKVIKEWGYTPVLAPNVGAKHGSFAGTPEERAADMLYGPIMALLGGLISDTIGAVLFPSGPYFFPYALIEMSSGFIFALFLYRAKLTEFRIILARFLQC